MSTCDRLDLGPVGGRPIVPANVPERCSGRRLLRQWHSGLTGGQELLVGSSSFSSYYGTTELTPQVSLDSFLEILLTSCLIPQVHLQSSTHTSLQGASKPFVAVSGTVPSNSTSAYCKRPLGFGEWQGRKVAVPL